MYRIYTFFFYCCSHFVSLTLLLSGFYFHINLEAEVFGPVDLIFFWLDIFCQCNIFSIELYASAQKPVIVV